MVCLGREKISLIKKKCHEYDEEWRPEAIFLGLNMEKAERNFVISAAREAGIKKIYQSYIDDNGLMNAGSFDE